MSAMQLCVPLSVSSAVSLIAVPVCSVFHNKSLTVDTVLLYVFKTCAALVLCVCVDGAETPSLINVAWRGVEWRGMAAPVVLYVPLSVVAWYLQTSPYSCTLNLFL